MIIADFQILADENISPEIVEFLRNKDIAVESIFWKLISLENLIRKY